MHLVTKRFSFMTHESWDLDTHLCLVRIGCLVRIHRLTEGILKLSNESQNLKRARTIFLNTRVEEFTCLKNEIKLKTLTFELQILKLFVFKRSAFWFVFFSRATIAFVYNVSKRFVFRLFSNGVTERLPGMIYPQSDASPNLDCIIFSTIDSKWIEIQFVFKPLHYAR